MRIPEIWFTAIERFDPSCGADWREYIAWAGLPHLKEVISLDSCRRPPELWNLIAPDWEHNIHEDYRIAFFRDPEYLVGRFTGRRDSVHILAVCLEPPFDVRESFPDTRFVFQGYDLVGAGDVSAITNCGGFDKVFQAADISEAGLFDSFEFARRAQKQLVEFYPDESHALTELWAIWKMALG
jgi:hypothetical protein